MSSNDVVLREFEAYSKKAEALRARKTRVEIEIEASRKQLQGLRDEANLLYETTDLGELRKKLAEQEAANAAKLESFKRKVDSAELAIAAVERVLGQGVKS